MTTPHAAHHQGPTCALPIRWLAGVVVALLVLSLGGCEDPAYDTSTPQATLAAAQKMIEDGRPDLLPTLIELQPRDLTFDDGVTEASAIGDVKRKLGDMLARLWRVSVKLKNTFPDDLKKEALAAKAAAQARVSRDIGDRLSDVFADPFEFLTQERENLTAEDMSDGTGTILWKGEPLLEGAISMIETGDGWRVTVPIELARQSGFWPETREEWAVVAYMMLGVENSLKDFERELDDGKFRTLRQASERIGRLIGESVVVQSIIYASMKQKKDEGSQD